MEELDEHLCQILQIHSGSLDGEEYNSYNMTELLESESHNEGTDHPRRLSTKTGLIEPSARAEEYLERLLPP